jgi:hypothetical protein
MIIQIMLSVCIMLVVGVGVSPSRNALTFNRYLVATHRAVFTSNIAPVRSMRLMLPTQRGKRGLYGYFRGLNGYFTDMFYLNGLLAHLRTISCTDTYKALQGYVQNAGKCGHVPTLCTHCGHVPCTVSVYKDR